jgi:hypothetical protein
MILGALFAEKTTGDVWNDTMSRVADSMNPL